MENTSINKKTFFVRYQFAIVALLALLAVGFLDNQLLGKPKTAHGAIAKEKEKKVEIKFWTWITVDPKKEITYYKSEFKKYKSYGLDAVLVNTGADPLLLNKITPIAIEAGLEVHAWMFTVNRPGDPVAQNQPDWYMVSRNGRSCYDQPPYVGYYKWLCPTRVDSRTHILNLVEGLAKVNGVSSVHLDYIRYPDIFLPIGLLPKYNLEQNTELPEYDFCYCEVCIAEFEKLHHKNPKEFEHPEIDIEWKNFRLNKIKSIVDEAYKIAHANNKMLTAAVFPYPEMAGHMVRQRWDKWKIDVVLPMVYHGFYNEELDWIGYATRQGVNDVINTQTQVHTGLYLPDFADGGFKEAIEHAIKNGAKGVSFFDGPSLTENQLKIIKSVSGQ